MNTLGMTTVGACTMPVMISGATPAARTMQSTTLPPTTAARRRPIGSPRRHSVIVALMTNSNSRTLETWGRSTHGFGTPTGTASRSPPQSASRSSPVTSRKLMFAPVVKLSASAARRVAHAASASQKFPVRKENQMNPTIDRTNTHSGTCAHRKVVA